MEVLDRWANEHAQLEAQNAALLKAARAWLDCAVYDENTHTWTVLEKADEYHDLYTAILPQA